MALFPHLLAPALWERPGNIPPLVRLIQAYIEKGAKQIPVENVVGSCLKVGSMYIFVFDWMEGLNYWTKFILVFQFHCEHFQYA